LLRRVERRQLVMSVDAASSVRGRVAHLVVDQHHADGVRWWN